MLDLVVEEPQRLVPKKHPLGRVHRRVVFRQGYQLDGTPVVVFAQLGSPGVQ